MPYLFIENFEAGLDTRKSRFTAPPGSLRQCVNAHITRGKEIEKRKAFVETGVLPFASDGLHSVGEQLFAFGVDASANMPNGVQYQQLVATQGSFGTLGDSRPILFAENFSGKPYVIAQDSTGRIKHFYNGQEVVDWYEIAGTLGTTTTVARAMYYRLLRGEGYRISKQGDLLTIVADEPNTGDTVSTVTVVGGTTVTGLLEATEVTAGVPPQSEVNATAEFTVAGGSANPGVNQVASVSLNSFDLIGSAVDHTGDDATTAQEIVDRVNAGGLYTASRSGATVIIEALDGLGAAANGRALDVQTAGDAVVSGVSNMSGGQDPTDGTRAVWTVEVTGFTNDCSYRVTVSMGGTTVGRVYGRSSAMPTTVRTLQQKMYAVTGSLVYFSGFRGTYDSAAVRQPALPDPTAWKNFDDDAANGEYVIGAGILNLAEQSPFSEVGVGLGIYQGKLAIFSEKSVQLWNVDPDPDLNSIYQVLLNIGAVSARSIVEYGDTDIFFLSETGVRSLRARDSSNLASTTDVGDPIDKELTAYMRTLSEDQIREALAIIEPREGRYMLAVGSRVYVFSNFPGSRVSAWTRYDTGLNVDYWAAVRSRLHLRAREPDDSFDIPRLYEYGGEDGETYDASPVTVELPFLEAGNPAGRKKLTGIDLGIEGTWEVEFASEPNNPDARELIGTATESTYGSFQQVRANALSTHFSLYLTNEDEGPAVLANAILHYDDIKAD